jgi:hypothetical protein
MKSILTILNEKKAIELKKEVDSDRKDRSSYTKTKFLDAKLEKGKLNLYFESINNVHGSGRKHKQTIRFEEKLKKEDITKEKLKNLIENQNIKLHCDCEDFLYAGFKYIGTIQKYSIEKETIKPEIRNPELKGSVCKHLNSVLSKLHLYVDKIIEKL